MKKFQLKITSLFAIAVMFFSCAKDEGPFVKFIPPVNDTVPDVQDSIPAPTEYSYTISFWTDVKPIFTGNCVMMCHNMEHPKLDLRPPVAYDQLLTNGSSAPYVMPMAPATSNLYLHLTGEYELMPQGGPKLSQGKIDTIYTWIAQGALDN
ncbi:MAG: hypothetical protein IPM74_14475 [Crocinitomicaceae bacterium]|nr:hypothetical protein [Crocinitomicaceae bacterium]MBK8927075.1 hypothetical protein [Crocinitomicaceae bacterium]